MDSTKKPQQRKRSSSDSQEASSTAIEDAPGNLQKTPVRPAKGTKRKLQSPSTTPSRSGDDGEKPGSAKKRRKSTSGSGQPLARVGSPSSLLKPPMTERQQMAFLLQMTDPQRHSTTAATSPAPAVSAGKEAPTEDVPSISPRVELTPKTRLQKRNERGETPLHLACIKGDLKTATYLVEQGADINATDHAGWTPLHEACNHGFPGVAAMLLNNGATVNVHGMDGDTPLHDATINNHTEVVKVLLGFDGDPNLPNDKEVTPIDICKDEEILRLLKGEVKIETQMKLKGRRTKKDQSEELAAVEAKGDTSSSNVVMSHTDSSNLDHNIPTISAASTTALIMTPRPKSIKPKGGFYSDISSSESESDYFESVSKKAARVVRLPRFQRESEVLEEVSEALEVDSDSVGKRLEETPSQEEGAGESHEKEQVTPLEPTDSSEKGGIPTCTSESPIDSHTKERKEEGKEEEKDTSSLPSSSQGEVTPETPLEEDTTAPSQDHKTPPAEEPEKPASDVESDIDVDTTLSPTLPIRPPESVDSLLVSVALSLVKVSSLRTSDGGRVSDRTRAPVKAGVTASKEGTAEPMDVEEGAKDGSPDRKEVLTSSSPPQQAGSSPPKAVGITMAAGDSPQEPSSKFQLKEGTEKQQHTRHSRKPQHVFSSKKIPKEVKKESSEKSHLECSESLDSAAEKREDSMKFSVSVGGSIAAPTSKSSGIPKQTPSSKDPGQVKLATGAKRREEADSRDQSDSGSEEDDEGSKSTIISFPTSLPIVFHVASQNAQHGSPSNASKQPTMTFARDTLITPPSFKPKTLPILLESVKSGTLQLQKRGTQLTVLSTESKDMGSQELEDTHINLPLPPKKRYRAVQRSVVMQQKREKQGPPPSKPAQYDSFLMCTRDYLSKKPLQPTNPKAVYPPVHAAMYKLFTEQEGERVRLASAHLAEKDRLVLSMEQELMRAHQRATKSHVPLSACSVLLERLLPKTTELLPGQGSIGGSFGERLVDEKSASVTKTKETHCLLDEPLLTALVQDVWDKFLQQKLTLVTRQRHEAEAMWLMQQEQWAERMSELGSTSDVPSTHVPITTSLAKKLYGVLV